MSAKLSFSFCALLVVLQSFGPRLAMAQAEPSTPRRIKVSDVAASSLLIEKTPPKYPEAAAKSGVQGSVVLKLVVAETGEVKDVSVVSGDPILAEAAIDAVKQWKYKPYTVDGAPVEMETEVSMNFHLKSPEHSVPPLGTFRDETYSNDFFEFSYPLSRDWVRETQLMRGRVATSGPPSSMYVLLAAVHIPQQTAPLEADSSFVLSALESRGHSCQQNLQAIADDLHSRKQAQQKGTIAPVTFAGREFYRADFDFRESPTHRTFLCAESKSYLLQWNVVGLSKNAMESTISTLNAIGAIQAKTAPVARPATDTDSNLTGATQSKEHSVRVKIGQVVSQGLLVKQVRPVYPDQARYAHIQGSVILNAIISKTGDIVDLEVLEGPIELVVSAVNAVRQWKYQPYALNGEPVEVVTQITVNYTLSRF